MVNFPGIKNKVGKDKDYYPFFDGSTGVEKPDIMRVDPNQDAVLTTGPITKIYTGGNGTGLVPIIGKSYIIKSVWFSLRNVGADTSTGAQVSLTDLGGNNVRLYASLVPTVAGVYNGGISGLNILTKENTSVDIWFLTAAPTFMNVTIEYVEVMNDL